MDNIDLKHIWSSADIDPIDNISTEKMLATVKKKLTKHNRSMKRNSLVEIFTAILLLPVFSYLLYTMPTIISKVGAAIVLLSLGLIIVKMMKIPKKKQLLYLSTQEYLEDERLQIAKQIKLIDTILYWYILPIAIGVLIFILGIQTTLLAHVASIAFCLVVWVGIYFLNKWALRKHFYPLQKELDELMEQLKKE